jgi:hypothetical protein
MSIQNSYTPFDLYQWHICNTGWNLRHNLKLHLNKNACYFDVTHSWYGSCWFSALEVNSFYLNYFRPQIPSRKASLGLATAENTTAKSEYQIMKQDCQSLSPTERAAEINKDTEALCDDVTKYGHSRHEPHHLTLPRNTCSRLHRFIYSLFGLRSPRYKTISYYTPPIVKDTGGKSKYISSLRSARRKLSQRCFIFTVAKYLDRI